MDTDQVIAAVSSIYAERRVAPSTERIAERLGATTDEVSPLLEWLVADGQLVVAQTSPAWVADEPVEDRTWTTLYGLRSS